MVKTLVFHPIIVDDFPSRWWVGGCIFLVRARGPGFQGQAGAAGPGARARPGPARAPKNAATNPPPRREIIDDSSIFGQSFNHTPNHNLNHNSNHNLNMFPVCSFRPVVCFLLVVIKSITETNGAAPYYHSQKTLPTHPKNITKTSRTYIRKHLDVYYS